MGIILLNEQNIRKSIALETSKGTKIDNYQTFEISQFEKNQFSKYSTINYPLTIFRNTPSPLYNCHGMSFASRRTNIDKSTDIRLILSDDHYQEIGIKSTLPGDFVLYINSADGDIAHSGIIVECKHSPNNISYITVVSKWGKFKEVIHDLNNCPYKELDKQFYRITHTDYEN